jgi:uncharacterized membrane protein YkvA (DUF1232 family)
MSFLAKARTWARNLKRDTVAVYFAARDTRTPLLLRGLALAIAAYALSPIDLIPDFIPVLGYLDDLLIVPFGLWLVIRMLPPEVLITARIHAAALLARPTSYNAAIVIVGLWLLCIAGLTYWWFNRLR